MIACYSGDAFPLTLTLSRRERGQPRLLPMAVHLPSPSQLRPAEARRGLRFSLSQREKAGVRENGRDPKSTLRVH